MASGGDNDWGRDRVGVHARLGVVVQSNECPVSHNSGDSLIASEVLVDDKVFDSSRIHQDNIRHRKDLR